MSMFKKLKATILGAFVLVPLAIMSGCTGDTNTPSTVQTGNDSVQGVVLDTVTGQGIAGVTIKSGWATVTTDKSGVYNLGTAPYTINSGNLTMPDAAYVVAIDTTTATGAATAGYGPTYFRRVTVSQTGNSDANILRIGKLSATVKGIVLNANGTFATNAVVTLTYFANGGNVAVGTGTNNSQVLTASSLSSVVAADGTYSIPKVEAGSQFQLVARSADGLRTTQSGAYTSAGTAGTTNNPVTLPPIDNFVYGGTNGNNVTNLVFSPLVDGAQPLKVLSGATITLGTAAATAANLGDYTADPKTVVTWTFTRAIKPSAYTATTGVYQVTAGSLNLNSVVQDVIISQTAKDGNIPYSVAFGTDMKSISVSFATSPSMVYVVDIHRVLEKVQDTDGAWYNGAATQPALDTLAAGAVPNGVAASKVTFSTSGAPVLGALPATAFSRVTGTIAGDSTITLTPVANSIGAFVYVQKLVNGIVVVDWTAFTETASNAKKVLPYGTAINLAAVSPGANTTNAFNNAGQGAFQGINSGILAYNTAFPYYIGVDKVSYNVKAAYVNADKVESAANTTAAFLVDDKTRPTVFAVTDDSVALGAAIAGTSYGVVIPATSRAESSITEANAALRNLPVFNGINTADSVANGGTATAPANFSGALYSKSGTTQTDKFLARVWFDDQMLPSLVTDGTKWGITDTALASATVANPYLTVTGASTNAGLYAGNCGVGITCKATIAFNGTPTVAYDSVQRMATISYKLNWTFSQQTNSGGVLQAGPNTVAEFPIANAAPSGSVYAITSVGNLPNFRFTLAGTDLNGNTIDNGLLRGF